MSSTYTYRYREYGSAGGAPTGTSEYCDPTTVVAPSTYETLTSPAYRTGYTGYDTTNYRATSSDVTNYPIDNYPGYGTTALSTAYGTTGLATGYGTTGLSTGYGTTGLATGYGTTGLSTAYGTTGLTTGYGTTGLTTGYGTTGLSTGYGTTALSTGLASSSVINTTCADETNRCIATTADCYKDPNPEILHRTIECPVKHEQRVFLRCLRPPPVPPGKLIIREVRPPQPPPPPPLIVRERPLPLPAPPPLILRERPPIPPTPTDQTITRTLPPLPPPPRSCIIERYPVLNKPRDIIIERWLPYEISGVRRRVVIPAPPAITYPRAHNQIILFRTLTPCVYRRFHHLGIVSENPNDYVARFGATLLDSTTLLHQARNVGVTEDLTCVAGSYARYTGPALGSSEYRTLPVPYPDEFVAAPGGGLYTPVYGSPIPPAVNLPCDVLPGQVSSIETEYSAAPLLPEPVSCELPATLPCVPEPSPCESTIYDTQPIES